MNQSSSAFRITRKNEEKDIMRSSTSSIQLRSAGFISGRFLDLTFSDGQEQFSRANENFDWFRRRQQRQFETFKEELEKRATAATTGGS